MTNKKTYIVDLEDLKEVWKRFEKRTRYEIRKCPFTPEESLNIAWFNDLHKQTRPDRKIDDNFISHIYCHLGDNCKLFITPTAGVLIAWDDISGYYLFGARRKDLKPDGSPSKLLWEAMKELHARGRYKFDLCGANKPTIAKFKRGFGGQLVDQPIENYFAYLLKKING